MNMVRLESYGGAFAVLLVMALIVWGSSRRAGIKPRSLLAMLVGGADGRLSTSKFQWLLWTVVAIFGFCAVFIERWMRGDLSVDTTMPTYLLTAMGLSGLTMSVAKGITTMYASQGLVDKTNPEIMGSSEKKPRTLLRGGLITDDHGVPDLAKIQMISFTFIAIGIYFVRLASQPGLPVLVDIDPALMVLMGLSQGAYLGKKLTTTEAPRINGMSAATAQAGDKITLSGVNFGDAQSGSLLYLGGSPVSDVAAWSDQKITFTVPAETMNRAAWKDGETMAPKIIVNGRETEAPFQLVMRA
jgi:IPT/TIG domain